MLYVMGYYVACDGVLIKQYVMEHLSVCISLCALLCVCMCVTVCVCLRISTYSADAWSQHKRPARR